MFYIRGMSEKQLIQQLKTLPAEARQEAADFIDYLHKKYFRKEEKHNSKKSILESAFRGIWKDREDMQDSTEWTRNIRKSRFAN